ncbi:hypothetical protein [aff. Roholtiella sp. LEGE 12411]|uniref:hypothetical protein n=1 Tax=aff. Roholtiella sp. LEGE 12411 TaxID=1828822 RepID=UPI001881971E|nr:hypothetical protein [aff. Roholtiella sp. LEGE 12411]MBE9038959.1 hypothetical protein [aff. Roholtiella sp. LEGE 12411]
MEEKNLKFDAEITFETEKLEGVPCEIVFPKTQNERVLIVVQFNTNNFSIPKIPFVFALNLLKND